jgi:hypothetical protein
MSVSYILTCDGQSSFLHPCSHVLPPTYFLKTFRDYLWRLSSHLQRWWINFILRKSPLEQTLIQYNTVTLL